MEKYEKMVKLNQAESKEKIASAIAAITKMEREGEKLQICELTKRTGLSRGFFYKNPSVRNELDRVMELQKGKVFQNPRKVVLDKAMEKQIMLLTNQIEKQKRRIEELEEENMKLRNALTKNSLKIIKSL